MSGPNPYRVLFVCWGNICRSPAAECVFRHLLQTVGLEASITCDSAGTIREHEGNPPDRRMRAAGAERGITIAGAARVIRPRDFQDFDLILAMDEFNLSEIEGIAPEDGLGATVALFCDYCGITETAEVPDPYYGGRNGFDRVLDLLEEGCANLATRIKDR